LFVLINNTPPQKKKKKKKPLNRGIRSFVTLAQRSFVANIMNETRNALICLPLAEIACHGLIA